MVGVLFNVTVCLYVHDKSKRAVVTQWVKALPKAQKGGSSRPDFTQLQMLCP